MTLEGLVVFFCFLFFVFFCFFFIFLPSLINLCELQHITFLTFGRSNGIEVIAHIARKDRDEFNGADEPLPNITMILVLEKSWNNPEPDHSKSLTPVGCKKTETQTKHPPQNNCD